MLRSSSFTATLLAATFLMGSGFVAAKILIAGGIPPLVLVGWRFLVAALATLPLIAWFSESTRAALLPKGIGLRELRLLALIGGFQTAGVMCFLFYAMRFVSASTAAILLFTNPLWVALLGRVLLDEALHGAKLIALVTGVAGVALALGSAADPASVHAQIVGELDGLAAALCWAIATIITKKAKLPMSPWALSFWQMLIGACCVLGIAYTCGLHWPASTTAEQWGWFLYLSIPASTVSFGLWSVALSRGGATRTSSYLFLAPMFAVLSSFAILHTALSWMQATGGALVGLSIWLINRDGSCRPSPGSFDRPVAERVTRGYREAP